MKKLSKLFGFTLISCLLTTQSVSAQTATASSLPDTVAGSTSGAVQTLNCDMVQCPMFSDHFLKVITWSEVNAGSYTTSVFVEFNGTQVGTTATIPNGTFADIVVGDNMNNPGNEYTVAVVYMIYSNPTHTTYLQTYNVDLNALTVTANPGPLTLSSPLANVKYAHIDLVADNATPVAGNPSLHKYVACWEGNIFNAVVGDINNIFGPTNTFLAAGGAASDVAAYSDGTNDYACFAYSGTSSGVDEWDITTTPSFSSTPLTSLGGESPRIEAMNMYGGSSYAKFVAVAYENMGTGSRINYASDLATGNTFTGTYTPVTSSPFYPVVAAGIGTAFGNAAYIGNSQYSYSFNYIFTPDDIWAQDIDVTTGVPAVATDFYEVNFSSTPSIGGGGPYASHALSSSSNTGLGLLSAYWDGTDIYYKVSSLSSFGFKTTTVNKIDTKQGFSLYPNPATNYLNINAPKGSDVSITDITGKIYMQTKSMGISIDISTLPGGLYIVDVQSGNNKRTMKFEKI